MGAVFGVPEEEGAETSVSSGDVTLVDPVTNLQWVVRVVQPHTTESVTAAARAQHTALMAREWMYLDPDDAATATFPGTTTANIAFVEAAA
jgi:hypothetical protein